MLSNKCQSSIVSCLLWMQWTKNTHQLTNGAWSRTHETCNQKTSTPAHRCQRLVNTVGHTLIQACCKKQAGWLRWHHSAVWTGTRMIVWGGVFDSSVGQNNPIYYDVGYSYDPVSDSWQVLSKSGRPPARAAHSAIWTGSAMIIFGGNSHLSLGGLYDPADDTWTAISHDNAVTYRQSHTGLWIGDRFMVWGGRAEGADGGIFVP
ncbi:Kelch repeat-containing protein [Oligoflexus tunisiensis]|uniref:Kelch repeat-containing protein n=1 Tax=Oligoflexus tunisiensis TaxID=708132 RepID=UPI003F776555